MAGRNHLRANKTLTNPLQTSFMFLFVLLAGLAILNEEETPKNKNPASTLDLLNKYESESNTRNTKLRDPRTIEEKDKIALLVQSSKTVDVAPSEKKIVEKEIPRPVNIRNEVREEKEIIVEKEIVEEKEITEEVENTSEVENISENKAEVKEVQMSVPTPRSVEAKNFELALTQSNGFFDDITDEQWKLLQKIARDTWPNHFTGDIKKYSSSGKEYRTENAGNWYNQNFHEEFHCMFAQRIPSHKKKSGPDGAKWVCDPHRIARQKECLVYSVGSNGNTMFEEGVRNQIGPHCEIHTFDVRSRNERNGDYAKKLRKVATFHHWGLGTQKQSDSYKEKGKGFPMKTLEETIKELGHEDRTIDILEIDCEGCEWDIHEDILKFDIRQIQIETHGAPLEQARSLFYSFHDAGYVITSKEQHFSDAACVEYAFLKLSPDFFINDSLYGSSPLEES